MARRIRYMRPPAPPADPLKSLQQGTYGIGGEILGSYSLYDTMVLATATAVQRLFTVAVGGAKTLDITNMTVGGQMPQGQNLTVKTIKLMYATHAALGTAGVQAFYGFLNHTTFEIVIPGKDVLGQWTLQEMFGASTAIALTPTAAGDNIPLILPVFSGKFRLSLPLVIAALTPFEIRITCHTASPAALDGDFMRVALNGTLRRSA